APPRRHRRAHRRGAGACWRGRQPRARRRGAGAGRQRATAARTPGAPSTRSASTTATTAPAGEGAGREHGCDLADGGSRVAAAPSLSMTTAVRPLVRLYDAGIGIILEHPSGVIYSNQTMGNACNQPEVEGVFVPFDAEDAWQRLAAHFEGPKYRGSGAMLGLD